MARKQNRVAQPTVVEAPVAIDVVASEEQSTAVAVVGHLADVPQGRAMIEAGTDQDQDPAPVAHVSSEIAEAFGMVELVPTGLVVLTENTGECLTDANVAAIEATEVEQPVEVIPEVADVALRLPGLLTASAAHDMAAFYASKLGMPLEIVRGNAVIETVMPGRVRAVASAMPRAVRTEGNGNLARALGMLGGMPLAPKVERDWSTYDARIEGGQFSNPKLWQQIHDAAEVADLDRLCAFNFAGSHDDGTGNTQAKNNGRYLRAMIAQVEATLADRAATAAFETDMERLIA
jgi:hypothetical protein